MDLGNLWSIITEPDIFLTALFGAGGFYLGLKQDRYARHYDGAHQTSIQFQRTGEHIQRSTDPEPYEVIRVTICYRGFDTLHGVRTSLVWENGAHWDLYPETHLHPGETLGPKDLEIPCSDLDNVHLHVAWQTPHPTIRGNRLRSVSYTHLRAHETTE